MVSFEKGEELYGRKIRKKIKLTIWVFPKIGVPQNGWFIVENPIMDDLGENPPFSETSIYLMIFCGFSRALVVFTSSPMLMRTPSQYLGEYIASVGLLSPTVSLVGCINNPHFM